MAGGFRTNKPSKNRATRYQSKDSRDTSDHKRIDAFEERFRSVEVNREERLNQMNRTFMGKMPEAYNPRW